MSYELKGTILKIEEEQTFPSGFSKRDFVVATDDRYPQEVKLQFTRDKCAQLDDYREGDPVRVRFNLRGNEYQGRHFVNLNAWKIEPDGGAQPARQDQPGAGPPMAAAALPQGDFDTEEDDDEQLPF